MSILAATKISILECVSSMANHSEISSHNNHYRYIVVLYSSDVSFNTLKMACLSRNVYFQPDI